MSTGRLRAAHPLHRDQHEPPGRAGGHLAPTSAAAENNGWGEERARSGGHGCHASTFAANAACGSSFTRSPTISAISCAPWRAPEPIKDWSLTSLKEKLIKIGAKVVTHGRYVTLSQMAEVAVERGRCSPRTSLRLIADLRPRSPPLPA